MTEQTITEAEIAAANQEAANSGLIGETVLGDPEAPLASDDASVEGNVDAGASTALANQGNETNAGETLDAPAESASTVSAETGEVSLDKAGSVGAGVSLVNLDEVVPTTGGELPTQPLLLATISVFRSRYDGQFFVQANTGEGYSAPNASTAGHVGGNLVAAIVQESINGKFEYAVA